jgi:hypothetical protein
MWLGIELAEHDSSHIHVCTQRTVAREDHPLDARTAHAAQRQLPPFDHPFAHLHPGAHANTQLRACGS